MGWTHHWKRPAELPKDDFAAAVADFRVLVRTMNAPLAGFDGSGEPLLDDDHIVFNGRHPQLCEPFEIAQTEFDRRGRTMVMSFCKTEHLPYDMWVQASLIILQHHLGNSIVVGSDGDDTAWESARLLVQTHLGYGGSFRLSSSS